MDIGDIKTKEIVLEFDSSNPNWNAEPEYNQLFIRAQMLYFYHLNQRRGHLFVNEVYDALGFPRTPEGAVLGWLYPEKAQVMWELIMTSDGKSIIKLFPDGLIWDKI